jgi:diguanylate cyclase (GGDEF)-like protein/PAS domain S-box-containing protein
MTTNRPSSFQSVSKWISAFVIALGVIVLAGWILNISALQSLLPGFPTMKGNTAVLFILSGISLWMQVEGQRPRIARAAAMLVALIGLLTLGEYVFDRGFGIDQVLFNDPAEGVLHPGRMSPASALCFSLIGFVLAFLDARSQNELHEYLIIAVIAMCALALLGYLYGVSSLYRIGAYSSMAVHTAINFLILSMGVLFARPQRMMMLNMAADTPGGSILRRFLPAAVGVPIFLGWLTLQGQRAGFYDTYFGLALMVASLILTLSVFIWLNAGQLTAMDIKRREINKSLHESELRFGSTLESMIEGCQIIGYDWCYLYLNDSAVKHSQQTREQLIGHTMMERYPGIENTALFESLQRCMNERMPGHMENEFTYPDGTKGWFELSVQPAPDGIFVLSSDITNRKKAEQAVLEREMKLSVLLDILPVGIAIVDAERNVSYTNSALKRILDISEEGLQNGIHRDRTYLRSDGTVMPLHEMASVRALASNKASGVVETGVVKEDDSIIWTQVSAVPVEFPDWKVVIVTSDITERKKMEQANAYLAAVVESSYDAIISKDLTGIITSWNRGAEKIFGYRADEMIGQSIRRLIPDHLLADEEKILAQISEGKVVDHFETVRLTKDGRQVEVSISVSPIKDAAGRVIGASKVLRDITERKRVENDLRNNERRLHLAASAGGVGIWDWDIVHDELIWDESMYSLYGIAKADFSGAYDAWAKTLHPEDRRFQEREVEAALRGDREYAPEFRIIRPDGTVRVIKATSQTIRDQNGKAVRMIGTNIDITEQKQAEQEILNLNAELELKVNERTAELASANEKLKQLSLLDQLTGLYNRHGFLLLAEAQLALAKRTRRNLLVFYADLDDLKQINDHHGHMAGDQALVLAARALEESFRTSDIKARVGGDEFIVLVVDAEGGDAEALLVRLQQRLAANQQSMSVGVVTWNAQMDVSMDDLIARADEAMYLEKRKKPGRFAA